MSTPIRRRNILAAAWSTPVVVAVAAAPQATASTAGFDLTVESPQLGSSRPIFNEDFTRLLWLDEPVATVIANRGTIDAPSGFALQVSYDKGLWRARSARGRLSASTSETLLPVQARTVSGEIETVSFAIPAVIPPQTDAFTGYRVFLDYDFLGAYPNDHTDTPGPTYWTILPVPGDLDPTNNVRGGVSYTDQGPVSPWGVVPTADYETRSIGSGVSVKRPTSVTWHSVGPNPTPAGSTLRIGTDAQATSQVRVGNVRINGTAAPGALSFGSQESYQDETITAVYGVNVQLAANDTLTFDVVYTDTTPPSGITQTYVAQTNFVVPAAYSKAQRATEISYLQY